MGLLVNKKDLSNIVGVSERTLTEWQEKGMPIKIQTGRGMANEYDTAAVIEWRVQFVADGQQTETMKQRKERLEGDILEIKMAELSGQFLDVVEVEAALEAAITSARAEFESSARKLKTKINKDFEIDVPLEYFMEHVRSTLEKFSEHAPEYSADDGESVDPMETALTA